MEFTLELAGVSIHVKCLHASTREFCKDYLTEGDECVTFAEADVVSVVVTQADIDAERARADGGPDAETGAEAAAPRYSDAYLETLAVYRKIAEALVERNILLFHGSAIAVDGEAYLFTALSGTGKSTHTRLWREVLPDTIMVNDDKPLLRLEEDGTVLVCGTPWNGKHRLSTNVCVPLKCIALLERGEENHVEPVSLKEAWPQLYLQSYRSEDPAVLAQTLPLLDAIAHNVKLYRLTCNMEQEAAVVSYEGMKGT